MSGGQRHMNPFLKYRIKRLINALGLRVRPGGRARSGLSEFAVHLRDRGFLPGTVIDVGVADGTFELYETFPEAFHLLVEPMGEFEPAMRKICSKYNADYILAAASDQTDEVPIYFSHDKHGASLVAQQINVSPCNQNGRKIRSFRLDEEIGIRGCRPPYLIKVDVQGFEHRVIEGAVGLLADTEVVILETALFRFKEGRPLLDESIAFMKQRNFLPYDIFGGYLRPLDDALAQVDIAFVKEDGLFRSSNEFATASQLEQAAGSMNARVRKLIRA